MDKELNVSQSCPAPTLKDFTVKPLFERKATDIIMAFALILLSIFAVSAIFWDGLQLGYTVVFDIAVIIIALFLRRKDIKPRPAFSVCGILSVVCSFSFAVTSDITVRFFALLVTALSAIICFASISGKPYEKGDTGLFKYAFYTVIGAFGDLPATFKGFFTRSTKKSKQFTNILIGVACAIPALAIIIPILLNSDDAFYALIHSIFDDLAVTLQKIIFGTALSVFVIGAVFSIKYNTKQIAGKPLSFKVPSVTLLTFLSILSFVYLVYLFSQLAYFFSAFSSILPDGYKFTYAQYARRGFFELCIISALNLIIVFAVTVISEKQDKKIPLMTRIPCAFIVVFTLMIIFTAISKMIMYINAYGFTVMRICTSAFMLWMIIVFITLLIRLFVKECDILTVGLISALVILSLLGICNVKAQTAAYNYNAYKSGRLNKIDIEYMSDLGDEGIPYLYKLTKEKDVGTAHYAIKKLIYRYSEYYDVEYDTIIEDYEQFKGLKKMYGGFGKYSISRQKAYDVLDKYAKENGGNYKKDFPYGDDMYDTLEEEPNPFNEE